MKDMAKLFKQAQEMQSRMGEMQEKLAQIEVQGDAGGGMVRLMLNGKGGLVNITIDPGLLNPAEAEILEDLIVAAHNDAKGRLDSRMQEEVGKLTGGLGLPPGFKLPF